MAEKKIPSDAPPDYEQAAAEHIAGPRPAGSPGPRRPIPPPDIPIIKHLNSRRVILASASPQRKNLLQQVGLRDFEIVASTLPEDLDKKVYGPWEYVAETARRKCLDVYKTVLDNQPASIPDPGLVLAADTVIVTRDGRILEKPRNEADHIRMLKHLRDTRMHRVLTAVTALSPREDARTPGYDIANHTEETKVYFSPEDDGLPDDVIEAYVKTREGVGKAGGYGIQGVAGLLLIEKIDGSMDNVIGLPVRKALALAEKVIFCQDEEEVVDEEDD